MNAVKFLTGTLLGLMSPFWVATYAQDYNYYYGNIHAHTSYSDGSHDSLETRVKTPAQAYAFAMKSKHMDFLGISEHNHSKAGMKDKANYKKGVAQAKAANKDGKFVCLYGMEFGTYEEGHILIYGCDELINWESGKADLAVERNNYNQVWQILADYPNSFATLAHPATKHYNRLVEQDYNSLADDIICGASVRNGPHESLSIDYDDPPAGDYYGYYKRMLAAGYRVGPTIDHDNHNTTFGRCSQGRTVLLAESLTKKNIIDAYRKMRFYASDDWNVKVEYTIDGKVMGETIKGNSIALEVVVADPDPDDVTATVKVMYGVVGSGVLPKPLIIETEGVFAYEVSLLPGDSLYLYLEIIQSDGDKVYTSPIWVDGIDYTLN